VETQQLLEGGAVAVAVEVRPHDAARLQERRAVHAGVGEAGARAQQQRVAHGSGVAHGQRHEPTVVVPHALAGQRLA